MVIEHPFEVADYRLASHTTCLTQCLAGLQDPPRPTGIGIDKHPDVIPLPRPEQNR